MERTLLIIKPDGMKRGLEQEIAKRIGEAGLRVVARKKLKASMKLLEAHYPSDESYLVSLGKKSETAGEKVLDYKKQGERVVGWLRKFMMSGEVVALVIEGEKAVKKLRKVVGYTDPAGAEKGTIRGDFGEDSILKANKENRPVKNLVHAAGSVKEALKEIKLWFPELG